MLPVAPQDPQLMPRMVPHGASDRGPAPPRRQEYKPRPVRLDSAFRNA